MATLAESFLADLDELDEAEAPAVAPGGGAPPPPSGPAARLLQLAQSDDLDAVAPLVHSERFAGVLRRVEAARGSAAQPRAGPVDDDPEYKLIVDCNALTADIDAEIGAVHAYVRDRYRPKFPELESLVLHPIDYARVVAAIGNEMEMTAVSLDGVLPSATIMVVVVTGSTTNGAPLPAEQLARVVAGCERALALDVTKRSLLAFVESRMASIAPNLSAVVGTQVAAQLLGAAGGLAALAGLPACNLQVLGAKKKALGGLSTGAAARAGELHAGFVHGCELISATPPALRGRACRLLGAKCALMARCDAHREDPAGGTGARMRASCAAKIAKWQEPPPARTVKPLPLPDMEPKKRRGGRRLRQLKERFGATDLRVAANRVNFNQPEEEAGLEGVGLGLVGAQGGGRLRATVAAGQSKRLQKEAAKFTRQKFSGPAGAAALSGLTSSVAFTPVQGIELAAPGRTAPSLPTGGADSVFGRGFTRAPGSGGAQQRQA